MQARLHRKSRIHLHQVLGQHRGHYRDRRFYYHGVRFRFNRLCLLYAVWKVRGRRPRHRGSPGTVYTAALRKNCNRGLANRDTGE